ncbi:MAG: penicillin-binding protein 1C [Ignavibacteriae bacterium]|nr:penicillin-binding protein 1C [Ignavibacteriota bacterium]
MNNVKLRTKKIFTRLIVFFLSVVALFSFLNFLFPLPNEKIFSKEVLANDGTLLTAYLSGDDKWRLKTSLNEITPELVQSIIEKEDKYFYWHLGVNPIAIFRAFFLNFSQKKIVSGASTITMQLARIWNPSSRTYLNKLFEILRAIQIEILYSKKEILEMYLNYLPYGGNIEGVKAASYIYFNRPPNKLSLAQSITLAVIPNDPNNYRLDKNYINTKIKRDIWINKFIDGKVFEEKILIDALYEPLQTNRFSMPKSAPHFCNRLIRTFEGPVIKSTLDFTKQKISEKLLSNYISRNISKEVTNGSVLIIENKTRNILAYCGSADYNNNENAGQVDGITAIRSPGSTLKPFLYAQAFDKGILTPKMKLNDIPMDFGGYEPENFDNNFYGEVTADFALKNSLNIPAVQLLQKVSLYNFIQILENTDFKKISADKNKLGLSLILGGCGTTLQEIVTAFSSFANKGNFKKINFELSNKKINSRQIFSESASYLVTKILSGIERPDFPNTFIGETKLPKIAWKTGTSYGKRDAWAIGVNPKYTIGVWLGNFSGKGSPYLSGAEMAVPLLFDLFNSIDYNSEKKWFDIPYEILERKVCEETGLLPTENCKNIIYDYYIENVSHQKKCDRYKTFLVDENETKVYCAECLGNNKYREIAYQVLDPDLKLWYKKNNIHIGEPPLHNPDCNSKLNNNGPKIISPLENYDYYIDKNSDQKLLLQAVSTSNVLSHYWYINDEFYKKCVPGEKIFFIPKKKIVNILCSDDKGGTSKIKINVKFY